MSGVWLKNLSAMGAVLFMLGFYPPQVFPQEKMTPVKVAEGVYLFENSRGSGNSTVVITDDGVCVCSTFTSATRTRRSRGSES